MKEVKLGIIGIGNMGYTHAKNVFEGKIDRLKLVTLIKQSLNKQKMSL